MNQKMFRCRLVRMIDGFAQIVTFIGPSYLDIPQGWSLYCRRVVAK